MSTPTVPATLTGTYTIDPAHSRVGFVARHAMVTKVRGSFDEFDGSGYFDAANPASSVNEPRTLVTMAWRATNPIRLWAGSMV